MTYKENIMAILECNFAGFKKEIIESACNRILEQDPNTADCTKRKLLLKQRLNNMYGIQYVDTDSIKTKENNMENKGNAFKVVFKYVSGYKMMLEDVDSVHTTADRIVIVHIDGEVNTLMKENVVYFTLCIQ